VLIGAAGSIVPLQVYESLLPVVGALDLARLPVNQLDAVEAQHELVGLHQPTLGLLAVLKRLRTQSAEIIIYNIVVRTETAATKIDIYI